jgi:hypothetical protein
MRAWTAFVTVAAAAAQSPPRPPCGSICSQGFALIRPAGRTWPVFAARGSICSQGFGVIRPAGELLERRGSCSTRGGAARPAGELLDPRGAARTAGELLDLRGSCSNAAEVATPARIPGPPARADPQSAAPNAPEWPPTRQSAGADPRAARNQPKCRQLPLTAAAKNARHAGAKSPL